MVFRLSLSDLKVADPYGQKHRQIDRSICRVVFVVSLMTLEYSDTYSYVLDI